MNRSGYMVIDISMIRYVLLGCSFRGSRAEAGHHVTLCGYRGLQPLETDQIQVIQIFNFIKLI